MKRLIITSLVLFVLAGCTGMRPKQDKVDPFEYMYPTKVDWEDPVAVLKSFYGAKKRGDWQKAFEICNFDETYSKDAARRIRDEWQKDSSEWPERYKFHDWYISMKSQDKDSTTLLVSEIRSIKDPKRKAEMNDYEEEMRLYGKKWNLVVPKVPGE